MPVIISHIFSFGFHFHSIHQLSIFLNCLPHLFPFSVSWKGLVIKTYTFTLDEPQFNIEICNVRTQVNEICDVATAESVIEASKDVRMSLNDSPARILEVADKCTNHVETITSQTSQHNEQSDGVVSAVENVCVYDSNCENRVPTSGNSKYTGIGLYSFVPCCNYWSLLSKTVLSVF